VGSLLSRYGVRGVGTCVILPDGSGRGKTLTVRRLDGVVLEDRVGQKLLAHLVHAGSRSLGRGRVDVHLDELPDPQPAHVAEAETAQRALHGRALHVEDAALEPDKHADLHASPARRKIASTLRPYQ